MTTWEHIGADTSMPVVVSYFTDSYYKTLAWDLLRSCQMFNLDYSICEVPHLGSWAKNTNRKPAFMAEKSNQFVEKSIVWVDADARFRAFPSLFSGLQAPVAYHMWRGVEALSGTVFFGQGVVTRDLLIQSWCDEVNLNPRATDQVSMHKAMGGMNTGLPVEYCYIWDDVHKEPNPKTTPVVEHMQASRFARRGR